MKTVFSETLTKFRKSDAGNFAILMALSAAVLVAGLAVAIDASNGYFAKQRLQDTTDAVALIAAKDRTLSDAELTATANAYFNTQYPGVRGTNIVLNSITRTGDAVVVDASNNIETYFAAIFGRNDLDVNAVSSAVFSQSRIDIALVLDSTFSMRGRKMDSLKIAATNLIDTLEDADSDDINVSVVPFAQYINVGTSRRGARWLDVPSDRNVTPACETRQDTVCRGGFTRVPATCTRDGVSFSCTRRVCRGGLENVGTPYNFCPAPRRATWEGCVGSRRAPLHLEADFGRTQIPGLVDVRCSTEMLPLTDNLNAVKSKIDELEASGRRTYMPSGLLWGWRTLTEQEPFVAPRIAPGSDGQKVLILMTDGDNTASKSGIRHTGSSRVAANRTTDQLCEGIKDSDIQVFTISYEVTDGATRRLIQDCANSNAQYFRADNAADLNAAFEAIGNSLGALRLTN